MSNPSVSQIKVGSTTYDIQDAEIRSRYYKHFPKFFESAELQNYSLNLNSSNTITPDQTIPIDAVYALTDYDAAHEGTHAYLDIAKRANGSIYAGVGLAVKNDQDNSTNYNTLYFDMNADGTPYINFQPGPQIWLDALGITKPSAVHATNSTAVEINDPEKYFSCDLTNIFSAPSNNDIFELSDGGIKVNKTGQYLLLGGIYFNNITSTTANNTSSIHTVISTAKNPVKSDPNNTIKVNWQSRVATTDFGLLTYLQLISLSANTVMYLSGGNLSGGGTATLYKGHLTMVHIA